MAKRKLMVLLGSILIILVVAGYVLSTRTLGSATPTPETSPTSSDAMPTPTTNPTDPEANPTPTASPTGSSATPTSTTNPTSTPDPTGYVSYIATSSASSINVAQTLVANQNDHEDSNDYIWDSSNVTVITLNQNSITASKQTGITISGTKATITAAGTYSITGTLTNGQIVVDTDDDGVVRIILNGASITSSTNSPLFVKKADKTVIILADNTANYLTDTAANTDNATLFSNDDLTIYGAGSLTVDSNAKDAIKSDDGLLIKTATITVTSVNGGIIGKDYIVVKDGVISVNSVSDCLRSDNDEEAGKGYIYIQDGTFTLTSTSGDAVSATTDLLIADGTITLNSGGGGNAAKNDAVSTKGLKGNVTVVIDNGEFTISSSDDGIHSNGAIYINNGAFTITTGDDGVHSDETLEINGGALVISKCYEGLESAIITINNGYIQLVSSDDGINAAGGNDGSAMDWRPGQGGMPRQGGETASGDYHMIITGGYIVVDSGGDGFDINGYITMSNGVVIINGPTANDNGALDYLNSFTVTGGILVAVGSSGMAVAPTATSTQYSVMVNLNSAQTSTLISLQTATGQTVFTFNPIKRFQSVVFSSPELTTGSYSLYLGGNSTGTSAHGLYKGGTYTPGTLYTSFTISSIVTKVGGGGGFFP